MPIATARTPLALCSALLVSAMVTTALTGCSGDDSESNNAAGSGGATSSGTSGNGGASKGGATSAGTSSTTGTDLRTLDTCTTDIAPGTPAFFSRYFKCVTVTSSKTDVLITSQNLPPHKSNYWGVGNPNYVPFDTSRGPQYRENPNSLQERAFTITIPKAPVAKGLTIDNDMIDGVVRTSNEEYPMSFAGLALDSVALFNPLAAAGADIEAEKYTFDDYNAHPDATRLYHYHTTSPGPLEVLAAAGVPAAVELFGIMCDGTVVLGCSDLDGADADLTALDAQGGHVTDIVDEKGALHFAARYHTHVCPTKAGGHPYTPEIQYYETCER